MTVFSPNDLIGGKMPLNFFLEKGLRILKIIIYEKKVYFLRIKIISLVESKVHETEKAGIEYRINTPYHGRHAP